MRHHVLRLCENILNKAAGHNPQRYLAIDSAEGQIVDLIPERRNIGPFAGIDIHRQNVFTIEINQRRQVKENGVYPPLYSPSRVPFT